MKLCNPKEIFMETNQSLTKYVMDRTVKEHINNEFIKTLNPISCHPPVPTYARRGEGVFFTLPKIG